MTQFAPVEPAAAPEAAAEAVSESAHGRADELAQIIQAYNQVTERLQHSHEQLAAEVTRLQAQLASKDAQLQRSRRLAALGEMAAGIAHEIRNPLGAISLYAGLMVEDIDGLIDGREYAMVSMRQLAGMSETALKIAQAVRGLDGIVNDVLSFSREIRPRLSAVNVDLLLDRAVQAHRPAIDAAQVRVERLCAGDDESPFVHTDLQLMHQALLNLIRNAVDAMGGVDAHRRVLTLGASGHDGRVKLTVRDTGPGIADHDIERIFNPFFTTRSTGTGLGLAIVHRIVEVHGGTIGVHNDGGAVFELDLPAVSTETCEPAPVRDGVSQ